MNSTEKNEVISQFIGKDVVISFKRAIYSTNFTMGSGVPYIKCKIIKVKSGFVLVQHKNKTIALDIDNIISIE